MGELFHGSENEGSVDGSVASGVNLNVGSGDISSLMEGQPVPFLMVQLMK